MKRLVIALVILAGGLVPGKLAAAPNDALFALYAKGNYAEAIKAGEAAHSAYGYALAARAVLADAALRQSPCFDCLTRAEGLARAAIAADPKNADAQVWLAVTLGYETRIKGMVWSRLHDLPGQARAALDAAIAADPAGAYGIAALGGWNIEVVKASGPFLAGHLFGASLAEGLALFDKAAKLAPGNVAVRYQIALSLAALDPDAWRARIGAELDAALHDTAATAYEKAVQARAGELKAMLGANRAAFDARVRKYQGYP